MPIRVVCPGCWAKLSVPDSAAGQKVRCPKFGCASMVPVPDAPPAEELPEDEPPPRPKPLKAAAVEEDDEPRRRRRDDADDDDDRPRQRRRRDEDDRPRRRRRRDEDDDYDDRPRRGRRESRGRSGTSTGKVVAIVLGSLLLLGGVGTGVYFLFLSKSSPFAAGNASPPSGWKEYTYADAGFKAYFPSEPRRVSDESLGILGEVAGRGLMIEYTARSFDNESPLTTVVYTRPVPQHMTPDKYRELLTKEVENQDRFPIMGVRLIESRTVTWMGHQVKEFRLGRPENAKRDKDAVFLERCVVTDTHEIHAAISMDDGRKFSSRLINGFFDNVRPLK